MGWLSEILANKNEDGGLQISKSSILVGIEMTPLISPTSI